MREIVINSAGLGDILNPTAGTSLDCGLFAGGVFKPACWCASFPSWCGGMTPQDVAKAKAGLDNPALYPNPPAPVGPASPDNLTTPVTGSDPASIQALIDKMIAEGKVATDSQNQEFYGSVSDSIDAAGQPKPQQGGCSVLGISCTNLAIIAAAGIGALFIFGGRR